ncbi:E3 ubiquitin-protein ligase TRIM39-like isoform X1 [Salvelinus fontinalis]|uniref:E3 ubiquitin-protein ligase TRIM39-like isoform X1 n=2 Tax=Salvelinus fontinalis TaxID=8038 RepID=UPI002485F7D0|nr:E3 ubiquitin-protein ligase TRIM39-like isoform X1 [Salvelinus fontinalis]
MEPEGDPGVLSRRAQREIMESPAPSCLSMNSARSMEPPFDFKREPLTPDLSLLTEDLFRCSVCSEVLRDPVSIPCGHSYCRQCISTYWVQPGPAGDYVCLQCSKRSRVRPVLCTNPALARLLQGLQQAGFSPALPALGYAVPGDVACDICSGQKLRAVKYCLTCTVSYCESHVRQHYTVPALQRHALAEVTGDWGHEGHQGNAGQTERIKEEETMETEEEERESVSKKMTDVKEEEEDSVEGLSDLKKNPKTKTRISEVKNLSKFYSDLKQENSELKHVVRELSKKNAVLQQEATFEKELVDIRTAALNKITANLISDPQQQREAEYVRRNLKNMIMDYVDVTLDPDTAHLQLILSEDRKQVIFGDVWQDLPDNPERFDISVCVLGKEGFSSGRFYYEVQVKGKTGWSLGVATKSINMKETIYLNPEDGYWTVMLRNGQYWAGAVPTVPIFLREELQKVGVFVDYKEGQVSFYNVEARSHIHSYTGYTFTEKLYPFFSPGNNYSGKNSTPLVITPVDVTD